MEAFSELGMVCDVQPAATQAQVNLVCPYRPFTLDFHQITYPIYLSLLAPPGIVLGISTLFLF